MASPRDHEVIEAIKVFRKCFNADPTAAAATSWWAKLLGPEIEDSSSSAISFTLPFKTIIVGTLSTKETEVVIVSRCADGEREGEGERSFHWAGEAQELFEQYGVKVNAVIVSDCPKDCGLSNSALKTVVMDFFQGLASAHDDLDIHDIHDIHAIHALTGTGTDSIKIPNIQGPYDSVIARHSSLILHSHILHTAASAKVASLPLPQFKADRPVFLMINSQVRGGGFNTHKGCAEAWAHLVGKYPTATCLTDVTVDMLDQYRGGMEKDVYLSAKHYLCEQQRVRLLGSALKSGDFKKAGELLTESHNSLKYYCGASSNEVDILIKIASQIEGVYGSRLVVDGTTRCCVSLVKRSSLTLLNKVLEEEYFTLTRRHCTFYECTPNATKSGLIDVHAAVTAADSDETFLSPLPPWIEYGGYLVPLAFAASVAAGAMFLIRMR
jgi:galactokinase